MDFHCMVKGITVVIKTTGFVLPFLLICSPLACNINLLSSFSVLDLKKKKAMYLGSFKATCYQNVFQIVSQSINFSVYFAIISKYGSRLKFSWILLFY